METPTRGDMTGDRAESLPAEVGVGMVPEMGSSTCNRMANTLCLHA